MVAAVVVSWVQLRHERMILFLDDNAAASAPIKALSRSPQSPAQIERFWGAMEQLQAFCWMERLESGPHPADASSKSREPCFASNV